MIHHLKRIFGPEPSPLALEWDEWTKHDAAYKKAHPFKFFIYESVPWCWGYAANRVSDCLWGIRHRVDPRHRYHVVRTGLKPGYHDIDKRMLFACFNLLVAYVGERHDPRHWQQQEHCSADDLELYALYQWWLARRQGTPTDDAEDTLKLTRLVQLRGGLWT